MIARGALLILLLPAVGLAAGWQGTLKSGDMHGRFEQRKQVAGLSKPLLSRGQFSFIKGHGLVWRTEQPIQSSVVLTGQGVFALDHGQSRRMAAGGEALALMERLLDGNAAALGQTFEVKESGQGGRWRLSLKPRPGPLAQIFSRIEAAGAASAQSVDLTEAGGDRTHIQFKAVAAGRGPLESAEEALLGP